MPDVTKQADNAFDEVTRTYHNLLDNYHDLVLLCRTPEDKIKLDRQFDDAESAFFRAAKRNLEQNDPAVETVRKKLSDANDIVDEELTRLTTIVAFLRVASAAVRLATSVAKLIAL